MLAGVACEFRGNVGKGFRSERLATKSGRDHHAARVDMSAIHGLGTEAVAGGLKPRDHPLVDVGHGRTLEPHSVIDEGFER
jgi:hypothetical protein